MSTTEPGQAAPAVAQREDIIRAYELVLGRAPDPNGLAYFISLAQSQQLNPNAIAKLLIASDESKASNGGLIGRAVQQECRDRSLPLHRHAG